MTTDARRELVRCVRWTVLVHAAFVLVMVVAKNALWGTDAPWWRIEKVFRLIELPVAWAIDRLLQTLPVIPPWAAFGRLWVATSVSEIILYSILGGTFYGLIAAVICAVRARQRETASIGQMS